VYSGNPHLKAREPRFSPGDYFFRSVRSSPRARERLRERARERRRRRETKVGLKPSVSVGIADERVGETLTFVFGTCASSISVHRQTMCRRVEFCWSVGQWRAFLRGQSLLFSRESSAKPAGPRARLCLVSSSFCDFSIFRSRAAERKWNRSRVSSSCFCGRMRVGETLICCLRHVCVKHQRPPSDDGSESRVLLECRAVAGIPPWPELAFLSRIVRAARGACDSRRGFLFSIPLDRAHHFFISLLGSRLYSYRFSPHAIKTFW